MYPNLLALFELVRTCADKYQDSYIEQALVELAQGFEISMDDIEDALYSDRCLVIYEP